MNEIKLTRGYVALVDDEDFEHLSQWNWAVRFTRDYPYAARSVSRYPRNPETVNMHRVIMGDPDGVLVHHIDNNGLNNQKCNLRLCTLSDLRTAKNHVGIKYGQLTILSQWSDKNYKQQVFCQCDCGKEKRVRLCHLLSGKIISCGCLAIYRIKNLNLSHGEAHKSREWQTWMSMKQRCFDPNTPTYKYYGGRGITVCDSWLNSFDTFLNDMGRRPPNLSIDRINVNGNYEPGKCRWATAKQQANNRRTKVKKIAIV